MKHIVLTGWKPGLKKITLVDLLKKYARQNLKEAHEAMVRLVEGGIVEVVIENEVVTQFVKEIEEIGVICECRET
jgi:hypothetical protein